MSFQVAFTLTASMLVASLALQSRLAAGLAGDKRPQGAEGHKVFWKY
jgi:hypothetical protein